MGKVYEEIDARIQTWMRRQKMYFVATAPLKATGLVNCSPKGSDTLTIIGPREIAYLDIGGSGIETVAHLKENQRIVIMMCSFDGPPKIFRFHGQGTVVEPHEEAFAPLLERFPTPRAVRNIIQVSIDRIADSCGYGVPLFDYVAERDSMQNYLRNKTEEDLRQARIQGNAVSLDGLPGLNVEQM